MTQVWLDFDCIDWLQEDNLMCFVILIFLFLLGHIFVLPVHVGKDGILYVNRINYMGMDRWFDGLSGFTLVGWGKFYWWPSIWHKRKYKVKWVLKKEILMCDWMLWPVDFYYCNFNYDALDIALFSHVDGWVRLLTDFLNYSWSLNF